MIPKNKFAGWMLDKVETYLAKREGCKVHESGFTKEGSKIVIQDSLGFVYQIDIKTIGRVQNPEQFQDVKPFKLERVK